MAMILQVPSIESIARRLRDLEKTLESGLTSRNILSNRAVSVVHSQGRATQSSPFVVRFFIPRGVTLISAELCVFTTAATEVAVSRNSSSFTTLGVVQGVSMMDITPFLSLYSTNTIRFSGDADVVCQVNLKVNVTR